MLAVAADIAIKAETLNPQLGEDMVKKTPGIVMIDELDVHLHPSWQRRVVKDLQNAFPSLQFICTTHSPQVIGETPRDKVQKVTRAMEGQGFTEVAGVALGADSNWLLEFEMGAKPRNERSAALVHEIEEALDSPDLTRAREKLTELRSFLRGDDGETVRLESTIHHLEALAREND